MKYVAIIKATARNEMPANVWEIEEAEAEGIEIFNDRTFVRVVDEKGRNIKHVKKVSAKRMEKMGIRMHHYELLFPKQVVEKCAYYMKATWSKKFSGLGRWLEESYLSLRRPYRVHMVYQDLHADARRRSAVLAIHHHHAGEALQLVWIRHSR